MEDVLDVAVSIFHTVAITHSGQIWSWGGNMVGQLGDGTTEDRSYPTEIFIVE